ncbi:tetratricopeptide repeat protein [candidate division KSB1 bacterium]
MHGQKKILIIITIIACFSGVIFIQENFALKNDFSENPEYDLYFVPSPEYLRMISAGFRETLADIYWIRTVVYFGRRETNYDDTPLVLARMRVVDKVETPEFFELRAINRVRFRYLYDMLNVITELDPLFLDPYTFGGLFLSLKMDRPELSIKLLEKGLRNIPENWQIPYQLGFNYYFYLEDKEKAVEYFMAAGEYPGCPPLIISLAQGILVQQGKTEIAIKFIEGVRDKAESEKIREEMEKILERLRQDNIDNSLKKGDKSL